MDAYLGEIRLSSFKRAMIGWAPCDGRLLMVEEYPALFSLLGNLYGGDNITTFGVPDLRGRVPVHLGQSPGMGNYPRGSIGGAEQVAITLATLPSHNHPFHASNQSATSKTPSSASLLGNVGNDFLYSLSNAGGSLQTLAGTSVLPSSEAPAAKHDNIQPTIALHYCIATIGEYPTGSI